MLRVQEIEISHLTPFKNNPRINDHAVEAVAKSIQAFGFNVPILCDERLRIIAGHTRWKAAKQLGMKTVPVITLRIDKIQQRAFAVAENKTATIAEWDVSKLIAEMNQLRDENIDLRSLGFSDAELRALLGSEEDFDWHLFDESYSATQNRTYSLVPVKVPVTKKEQIKNGIEKAAGRFAIKGKDSAVVAGEVLMKLLRRCK